jgi:hypothetical protein
MRIKPRPAPPTGETCTFSQLIIRHPHYDDYNTLLKLPALDEGDTIDYDTALTICGIVCDNSYGTGWFAKSRDGSRICATGTPLVAGEVYYFATEDRSCRSLLAGSLSEMLTMYAQINTRFAPAGTNGAYLRTSAPFHLALPHFKFLLHLHT